MGVGVFSLFFPPPTPPHTHTHVKSEEGKSIRYLQLMFANQIKSNHLHVFSNQLVIYRPDDSWGVCYQGDLGGLLPGGPPSFPDLFLHSEHLIIYGFIPFFLNYKGSERPPAVDAAELELRLNQAPT